MNKYDIDYFIAKFSAIPDDAMGVGNLSRACALHHCGVREYGHPTDEAIALAGILRQYVPLEIYPGLDNVDVVWMVNDWTSGLPEFIQPPWQVSPRARILAALHDAKAKAEAALEAYELRPLISSPKQSKGVEA